jgi:hypothetical protein
MPDVMFCDDLALNLLYHAKPLASLKNQRKKPGCNQDYLETVIRQAA